MRVQVHLFELPESLGLPELLGLSLPGDGGDPTVAGVDSPPAEFI
jgi:hypothetical protein